VVDKESQQPAQKAADKKEAAAVKKAAGKAAAEAKAVTGSEVPPQ